MTKRMNSLTRERLVELLEYKPETGEFVRRLSRGGQKAGAIAGTLDSHGYVQIKIDKRLYLAHRLAWLYVNNEWPFDVVDHINGIPVDNRIKNLRAVSKQVNCQNRRRASADSRTGYLGVTQTKYGFVAAVWKDGKSISLGTHATPQIAHEIYRKAKRELHEGCTL